MFTELTIWGEKTCEGREGRREVNRAGPGEAPATPEQLLMMPLIRCHAEGTPIWFLLCIQPAAALS